MCDISKEISENLMKNAIDFFEKSIEDFDKQEYKYSIIHFSSALEAIFKSRLAYEHWSLIVKDWPPNIQKMKDGSVHTVGAKDCLKVMKSALRENIGKEQENAFEAIFNERNKAVHYHLDLSDNKKSHLVNNQFTAYCQLFKILPKNDSDWGSVLKPYRTQLDEFLNDLTKHLGFKYELQKDKYKNRENHKCERCSYISKVIEEEDREIKDFNLIKLYETHCFTCGWKSLKRIDEAYLEDTLEFTLEDEESSYLCHCEAETAAIKSHRGDYLYICLSCNKAYEDSVFFECGGCRQTCHEGLLEDCGCGEGGRVEIKICKSCYREPYELEELEAYRGN